MGTLENLSGKTFGRLTVTELHFSRRRRTYWRCRCSCGVQVDVIASNLKRGNTKSCGCFNSDLTTVRNTRHGDAQRGSRRAPEYTVWHLMIDRCTNPESLSWSRYGGRGIKVCDRWLDSYLAFRADMGSRPTPEHEIDRIDNDGNYEPENCRWATKIVNANNRSDNVPVTYNGRTMNISEWSRETGISVHTLWQRLFRLNWDPADALTRPVRKMRTADQMREARANRQEPKLIEHAGQSLTMSEWGRRIGASPQVIWQRINNRGWSIEKALTTPVRQIRRS